MQATGSARDKEGDGTEFLTFTLGNEEYAIDILKVQEIRGYNAVTRVANSPAFIKGVINLRGSIVPIVDLRVKFGALNVKYTPFTVVIILYIGKRMVGVVVDGVSDVMSFTPEAIRPAPEFSSSVGTEYISGLVSADERMLVVLDIERLLLSPDMCLIEPTLH